MDALEKREALELSR
jgi:hypothetical protein